VNLVKLVRQPGAEQRTLEYRGNPVALETRLAIGIDDGDPGSPLSRVVEILGGDRLVVWRVATQKNNEIRANPVVLLSATVEGAWQSRAELSTLLVPR
jgi:hypothetical protein